MPSDISKKGYSLIIVSLVISIAVVLVSTIVAYQYIILSFYKTQTNNLESEKTKISSQLQNLQQKAENLRQSSVLSSQINALNEKVNEAMNKYAKKPDGDISIYFKNLTTGDEIIIGGEKKYYMASLYKVILTLYVLDKIKSQELSFDDLVGTSSATIEFALNKIITESNNEYAQTLGSELGWKKIERALKEKLQVDFSLGDSLEINIINVGKVFESIALSLNIDKSQSSYLLKLLNSQQNLTKLPKYLPDHIYSHNKTGEFESFSHDAGIFYTPKANYILAFMSKTSDPSYTNEQMALMSKDIYTMLNN